MSTDTTAPGAPIALRLLQDGTLAASRREVQAGLRYRLQIQPAAALASAALLDAQGQPLAAWSAEGADPDAEPTLDLDAEPVWAAVWGRSWAYRAPVALRILTAEGEAASVSLDLRPGLRASAASSACGKPSVQADTVLRWHDCCSLLAVTPLGALTADATGWPEGRQLFVRLTLGANATLPANVHLVGYDRLQDATTYQATVWRVGDLLFLSPILAEEGLQ